MLALALSLPAVGQHHNQDRPRDQNQPAPHRQAPRPPHPDHSPARSERTADQFHAHPQGTPGYSQPHVPQRPQTFSQGPTRDVARPPGSVRPSNRPSAFSEQGSQPRREVPRPPVRGEQRVMAQPQQQEQREVARPPAVPGSRSEPVSKGPARSQDVARPPQTFGSQTREVPRPPNAAQRHGGDWLRTHRDLSPADQQKALQSDPQFRKLPPQQQQRLVNRLHNFNNLPPQEQQRRLNRVEVWEHLTPQQKQQARQLNSQWKQLPAERRQVMKTAIGDLRAMPPDQRERVLESDRFKGMFSDQERNMLRETTRLPLAPAQPSVPRPPQE